MRRKNSLRRRLQKIGMLVVRCFPVHKTRVLPCCLGTDSSNFALSCFSVWKEHQYIVSDWNGPWFESDAEVLLRKESYCKWKFCICCYLYCNCLLALTVSSISLHCRLTIPLRRVLWVPASEESTLSDVMNLGKSVALLVNYARL